MHLSIHTTFLLQTLCSVCVCLSVCLALSMILGSKKDISWRFLIIQRVEIRLSPHA